MYFWKKKVCRITNFILESTFHNRCDRNGYSSGERWLWGDKEYCAIIILDVFNSAGWDATWAAPDGKGIPNYLLELTRDDFKDRVLIYDTDDGRKSYAEQNYGMSCTMVYWGFTVHWICGRYCPGNIEFW